MRVSDGGDPDNGPRPTREFRIVIAKDDNSWKVETPWGWYGEIANWTVELPSEGTYRWWAYAGDGAYESSPAGPRTLHYRRNVPPNPPNLINPAANATVNTANVTLHVTDGGDPDNGPHSTRSFYFIIVNSDQSWRRDSGWMDSAHWTVTLPTEDTYQWSVFASDGLDWRGSAERRVLTFVPTYTISGRITTPTGAPLTNVTVSDGTRSATTDANGNYTLTNVPAGTYTLTPSRNGYTFTPPTRTVTVDGHLSGMDFVAIFGFVISGQVLDDAGTPVVGVTISTGTHSTTTDSTGAFTLAGLAAGAYTLTPTKAGYAFDPPSRRVQVNGNFTGIAFRAFQPDPAKPIDLIVSFDGNPTPAQRAMYEDIFRSFADAVFEFTNGAHKVRTVQFYPNGARRTDAHIRWLARCLPQANVGSALIPGAAIVMCDTIDNSDTNLLTDPAVAGYILAHNWGHAYYGLYDEGPLNAPCPPNQPDRACHTDEAVTHALMNPQAPWQARTEGPVWLNASTVLNRRTQTA
ncbi:MAG: carboxypeptidase regulatory-like domain-containing protein, partial [Chloroflexus sp.]